MKNEIPPFSFVDKSQQYNCFIIEDCDVKNDLNREQRTLLGNYYRVASHMNIDLFTITQNPFDITPTLRRVANVVILFKNNDLDMLNSLCRKFNVKSTDLKAIFDTFTPFDSLVIDDTRSKHLRLRKNLFQVIELE